MKALLKIEESFFYIWLLIDVLLRTFLWDSIQSFFFSPTPIMLSINRQRTKEWIWKCKSIHFWKSMSRNKKHKKKRFITSSNEKSWSRNMGYSLQRKQQWSISPSNRRRKNSSSRTNASCYRKGAEYLTSPHEDLILVKSTK